MQPFSLPRLLAGLLSAEGYSVAEAGTLAAATRELGRAPVDLVISDWRLPDGDGGELLARVRAQYPDVGFVMVTAYGTIARAVEAVPEIRLCHGSFAPFFYPEAATLKIVEAAPEIDARTLAAVASHHAENLLAKV